MLKYSQFAPRVAVVVVNTIPLVLTATSVPHPEWRGTAQQTLLHIKLKVYRLFGVYLRIAGVENLYFGDQLITSSMTYRSS